MSARFSLDVAALLAASRKRHAVVVGGSLVGMLAARVLSDHFDSVTLLERDCFPEAPAARKGLPQGRHVHGLLERGRRVMEHFFPGFTDELVHEGATAMDFTQDVAWMSPYGWFARFPGDILMLACTRDLIDWCVRRRVAALPNVFICQGVAVSGLIRGPREEDRVTGVRVRSRIVDARMDLDAVELRANLVVVADGRNSHLPEWLAKLGYRPPEEAVVNSFQGYASRLYRPPAQFESDWKSLYVQQAPPDDPRGGLISPVEGGRWLVSLVGGDGDYPPTDKAGFLSFARSLRSPMLYEAIAEAEPLTEIAGQRGTENRLRHYDRPGQLPDGVVVLGDAVCAFNPVYGQGMTAAALRAEVLDRFLQEESHFRGAGNGQVFQQRLVRAIAAAWQLSSGADNQFRSTEGPPQGWMARLTARYLARVMRASTRRPWMRRRLTEVLHLVRSPSELLDPGVLMRLVWDRLMGGADWRPQNVRALAEDTASISPSELRTGPGLYVETTQDSRG
jgi:2-polyprenyl-6-methoxyphenol hydroxylase-like FAD-dependent oxidoreductase